MSTATRLRQLVRDNAPVMAPGAYDVMTAKLIQQLGFPAVYLGSYAFAASRYGLPDQSLITLSDLLDQAHLIADAVEIPLIVDLEEGGGNAVNTYHNVRRFEAARAAAMHIEDHKPGKLYGRGGQLYPIPEAVEKLKAAVDARRGKDTLIIARCEALYIGRSQDEAMERSHAYAQTGADMLIVTGLPLQDTQSFGQAVGLPMVQFVFDAPETALHAAGVKLALYWFQSIAVAHRAVKEMLTELKTTGASKSCPAGMATQKDLEELVGAAEGGKLAARYKVI